MVRGWAAFTPALERARSLALANLIISGPERASSAAAIRSNEAV
jgi:hypothetical protein